MKKIAIILFAIFIIYSCSSGNGGDSNSGALTRPALNSTIDLRLGQLSSGSSVVAVSAALQNGESITSFTKNGDNFSSIYVSPNSTTLQVDFDTTGRPSFAQFQNTTVSYSNYTKENTVDITIQTPDSGRTARTIFLDNQPINQDTLDYLNGDEFLKIILGIDQDQDSGIRAILAATIGALRIVGCSSIEELRNIFPDEFLNDLCSSELLDGVEEILGFSNYQTILVNLINRHPECDTPANYNELSSCAIVIWDELTEAANKGVVGNFPSSEAGGSNGGNINGSSTGGTSTGEDTGKNTGNDSGGTNTGSTDTENNTGDVDTDAGQPTPTPTPTPTPPPGGASLIGQWKGSITINPSSPGCTDFELDFIVTDQGDPNCINNNCGFTGILTERITGPVFTGIIGTVTGTSSTTGEISVSHTQNPYILVMTGPLDVTNLSGLVTFSYSPTFPTCTGTISVLKVN